VSEKIAVVAGSTVNVFKLNLQRGNPKPHHLRKDKSPYPSGVYK
jgi:hypothetical protein